MATRQKGLFKPVPRRNDMEPSMYKDIEKIAKECVKSTKEIYKNKNDIDNYNKNIIKIMLDILYIRCSKYKKSNLSYIEISHNFFFISNTSSKISSNNYMPT